VTTLETDVLIIGSGAGGAVTAATLARAGRDVTIVATDTESRNECVVRSTGRGWALTRRGVRCGTALDGFRAVPVHGSAPLRLCHADRLIERHRR
jgi:2-polyprenyl-6-methoxyphenol hydroxylase-like FAD-dependent oxidoreductase